MSASLLCILAASVSTCISRRITSLTLTIDSIPLERLPPYTVSPPPYPESVGSSASNSSIRIFQNTGARQVPITSIEMQTTSQSSTELLTGTPQEEATEPSCMALMYRHMCDHSIAYISAMLALAAFVTVLVLVVHRKLPARALLPFAVGIYAAGSIIVLRVISMALVFMDISTSRVSMVLIYYQFLNMLWLLFISNQPVLLGFTAVASLYLITVYLVFKLLVSEIDAGPVSSVD